VVTLDQWLAAQFQESALGALVMGPRGLVVVAAVALVAALREQARRQRSR